MYTWTGLSNLSLSMFLQGTVKRTSTSVLSDIEGVAECYISNKSPVEKHFLVYC